MLAVNTSDMAHVTDCLIAQKHRLAVANCHWNLLAVAVAVVVAVAVAVAVVVAVAVAVAVAVLVVLLQI